MKRAMTVLVLTSGAVLMPTAAFAATGDTTSGTVTAVPIFVVVGPPSGGAPATTTGASPSASSPADVAGPPVPLGPYAPESKHAAEDAKHAAEDAKHAAEHAKHAADEAKHAAKQAAEAAKHATDGKDGKDGEPALTGLASATSYSPWNNAALVSGGGRTFG